MQNSKIITSELKLEQLSKKFKKQGKKIILCHGVFDLLHIGHIKYLYESSKKGDVLFVTITENSFVDKTPERPFFSNSDRVEAISALDCVSFVMLNKSKTAVNVIKILKPDFYCKGPDYKNYKNDLTGEIKNELKILKLIGGKFYITNTPTYSSSSLLNNNFNTYSKNIKENLKKIKIKFPMKINLEKEFKKLKNQKVVVLGEAIIDEYTYCEALGKSGKEPILNFKEINTEKFLGGSLAIANHLSTFCKEVKLISFIGDDLKHLKFIKQNLKKNVKFLYLTKKSTTTIVKKRLVEGINNFKLLGLYQLDEKENTPFENKKLYRLINKEVKKKDILLIGDYNHGVINDEVAKFISKKRKYNFNLMSQINSSSLSNYALKKYKFPHLIVINERELRHEFRDKNSKTELLIKKYSNDYFCKNVIVTAGKKGFYYFNKDVNKVSKYDAFTDKFIDKIGAGDVIFATLSLFFSSKLDRNLSMIMSSIAGHFAVNTIANKNFLELNKLKNSLFNLLK